ncbi:MAG: hypothetical protein ACKVZ6_10005 [Kineosporiaceae bacterium]
MTGRRAYGGRALRAAAVGALAACLVAGPAGLTALASAQASTRTAETDPVVAPSGTSAPASSAGPVVDAVPMLAYYYIWFDPSSWDRAKKDTPLLGRYSSDERAVMRRHIELARSAGIDGFLVSWKDTPKLTERLHRLVEIAREQHFKLGIVYQGLDFARRPIPVAKVAADLALLADTYAKDPVFDVVGKRPLVVWTGTDQFSDADLRRAVDPVRDRLSMLASARSIEQWRRVHDLFEGNAYYWSSVNPVKTWYPRELSEMGQAVHATGDLWVAPAASGFDATLVGGKTVVDRANGRTLASELATAVRSTADVIGLISWNEFTENSHVEPSRLYGSTALEVVAGFTGSGSPLPVLDSGATGTGSAAGGLNGVAALSVMFVGLGALLVWRLWRRSPDDAGGGVPRPRGRHAEAR